MWKLLFKTRKSKLTSTERYSLEKLISALTLLVSAVVGILTAFGKIDPGSGDTIIENTNRVAGRLVESIERVWPLLSALGALWWRRRIKDDD